MQGKRCGTPTTMTRYKIVLQQPYKQQQQKHAELPSSRQALPKLPMRQFGISVLHYWYYSHLFVRESWLSHVLSTIDLIHSSHSFLETHYKMQNNHFYQASTNDKILHHEGV
jgi:hypothetical protein